MLKSLLISATLLGSLATQANTVKIAEGLFAQRGSDVKKAVEAAKIYGQLAAQESDKLTKGKLMVAHSEANFYVGTQASEKKEKQRIHSAGYTTALSAVRLLREVAGDEAITERSRALYFYGANLGRWGETKFITKVLKIWKKQLRPRMMTLKGLDDSVEDYGVYRILGRAFIKVPGEDNDEGLKFLEKAYEATKVETEDFTVAKNPVTNHYLLWAYEKQEEVDKFCELYDNYEAFTEADKADQDAVNPSLIPETQVEIKDFKESRTKEWKKIKKYYSDEC